MNIKNEFDDLAWQKLEGRSIPFDENHWVEMQAVMNAQKKRKNRFGFWSGGGAALLLLIGGAWYLNGTYETNDVARNEVAEIRTKTTTNETIHPATTTVADDNNGISRADGNNTIITEKERNGDSISGSASTTNDQLNDRHEVAAMKELNAPTLKSERKSEAKIKATRKAGSSERDRRSIDTPRTIINAEIGETNDQVPPDPKLTIIEEPSFEGANDHTNKSSLNPPGQRDLDQNDSGIDRDATAADVPSVGKAIPPDPHVLNPELAVGANTEPRSTDPFKIVEQGSIADAKNDIPPALSDSTLLEERGPLTDSSATAQAANDTTILTPDPAVQLISPNSPWEVSVLGGAMLTNTRYTGANSDTWNSGVQQQWSMNAGMEVMHVGRNFGLGTGLHYGTYSERINANAIDNTTFNVSNFWYLVPVDTTILTITGTTTVDTNEYFTGISIDTTINVITRGSDSTAVTDHMRDAREIVNKVSYIEIPLLLDAHLLQGRWSLGVRGGPTIGLLTGRRGSLPNESGDGYTNLTDQPFREVVFGWTARAYVRYRFNAAWSIGVEPMMRGQFNNTLGNGDLSRKSTAYGVLLSLSYRLR